MADMPDYLHETRDAVLDAALPNVTFDGWSEALFRNAIEESGVAPDLAKLAFPRGPIDLAAESHRRDDRRLLEQMESGAFDTLRMREKITQAVRARLEIAGQHEEAVRRAAAMFALPHNAPEATRLTWGTVDTIWRVAGDTSEDYNWYTKRLTLSGVYSATLLFWLGDQSEGKQATWQFLDRRIEDVMRIEKVKAKVRENPLAKMVLAGPMAFLNRVKAPTAQRPDEAPTGFPGRSS